MFQRTSLSIALTLLCGTVNAADYFLMNYRPPNR